MDETLVTAAPLRPLTALLAEMQTTINAAGLRAFDGDIDRFVIFTLILRESVLSLQGPRPVSAHSLAISLGRSFETVRRHVIALVEAGLCVRSRAGVAAVPAMLEVAPLCAAIMLTHDCFVRFVEDFTELGGMPPTRVAGDRCDLTVGVAGAVDVMLGTIDSNRALHGDWLGLVLFSTVFAANAQALAVRHDALLRPHHAVRASVIARTLGLPETTVRRRVAALVRAGVLERTRAGLLVSQAWLGQPEAEATTRATLSTVRRILARAAASGFPVDAPAQAYRAGRPPAPRFA